MNDRKRHVLLTAQRLFVEKGFSATSVQDVLDESHISKGTFYNYFTSKNECLMAILEHARDEASVRRQELLIGQDVSDKGILAEQISIRMQVNREHNLIPLFETIFYSGDLDLRAFIKKHHLTELSWLTGRLVDVYGENAAPYAPDCAVMMLGMMQHMIHVWTASSKEELDADKLIAFTMRRIDSIISNMIGTKDVLLGEEIFFNLDRNINEKPHTKQQILEQLTKFYNVLGEDTRAAGKEYVQFLIDELRSAHPKIFIMETIIHSFQEAFTDTPHESDTRKIASNVWRYTDTLEK